jgi:general secretion pathway protein H
MIRTAMKISSSRTGDAHGSERGFTLIELLVAITILALAMAVVPSFLQRMQNRTELNAAERTVAAALRETRNAAIASGRAALFTLDTGSGAFRVGEKPTLRHLPKSVRLILFTTTEDQLDAQSGSIRFFADGSATGGGVRLTEGRRHSDVLVDWLTGRVSISDQAALR